VVAQAIVPTTPQFLKQNLRGPQLLQMSDMQVAATQEAVAKGNMMQQIASDLYADMSWGLGEVTFARSTLSGLRSGFLYATLLNLGLRLVVVDRVDMRMAGQATPHELFADVVDARVRVDLDLVGAFGALDTA
jgi:hypothetical protein